jgi:hypothetical protein
MNKEKKVSRQSPSERKSRRALLKQGLALAILPFTAFVPWRTSAATPTVSSNRKVSKGQGKQPAAIQSSPKGSPPKGTNTIRNRKNQEICFSADTKVLMADRSKKAIAEIKEGEKVQSFNFMTNRLTSSRVTRLHRSRSKRLLVLNGALRVTKQHPFAIGMDVWKEAGRLKVGDRILGKENIYVEDISELAEEHPVYNLTVDSTNNYYVLNGKSSYLVHNKGNACSTCCFIRGSRVRMSDGKLKKIERVKVGDKVRGFDFAVQKWKSYPVTELQSAKRKFGYYLINKALKVTSVHRIYVDGAAKRAPEICLGDRLSNGRKDIRVTSIELIQEKAEQYNFVIGRDPNVGYLVDGLLALNGW